jgi:hypothetical protein
MSLFHVFSQAAHVAPQFFKNIHFDLVFKLALQK